MYSMSVFGSSKTSVRSSLSINTHNQWLVSLLSSLTYDSVLIKSRSKFTLLGKLPAQPKGNIEPNQYTQEPINTCTHNKRVGSSILVMNLSLNTSEGSLDWVKGERKKKKALHIQSPIDLTRFYNFGHIRVSKLKQSINLHVCQLNRASYNNPCLLLLLLYSSSNISTEWV